MGGSLRPRLPRLALLCAALGSSGALAAPTLYAIDAQVVDSFIFQLPPGLYTDAGSFIVESDDVAQTGISNVEPLTFDVSLGGESWDESFDAGESIRFVDGGDPRVDYDGVNGNGAHLDMVVSSPGGVMLMLTIGGAPANGTYSVRELPEASGPLMLAAGVGALSLLRWRRVLA